MSDSFHAMRKERSSGKSKIDQFYTKPRVVKKCLEQLALSDYDCIVEPSAGAGAFLDEIAHPNIFAMDIEPRGEGIAKQNFLDFSIPSKYEKVLIFGNPPFGMYHKLSDTFLSHSFSFSNVRTIGFILPNTYNKHTRQRIVPRCWRIKSITPLGKDAFVHGGESYHVPCSFFVLDRSPGKDLRMDPSLYKEAVDFAFGTKDDYAFFIFGAAPHKIVMRPKPNNRGYFIKPKIPVEKLIKRIKGVNWVGNSCANGGVAWFTKPEVVAQYNKVYG